jgi:hypothetical protein
MLSIIVTLFPYSHHFVSLLFVDSKIHFLGNVNIMKIVNLRIFFFFLSLIYSQVHLPPSYTLLYLGSPTLRSCTIQITFVRPIHILGYSHWHFQCSPSMTDLFSFLLTVFS